MISESQKRASKKYESENVVKLCIKLNKKTDADVLEKLGQVDSKQGYIKELIRKDISK